MLIFLTAANAMAQTNSAPLFQRNSVLVKWNPLSLIDVESTTQFSGEYFVTSRSSVQAEVGYGPPFLSYGRSPLENRQAWRLRTEYRLYRLRAPELGRYLAIEGFAMTVNGVKPTYSSSHFSGNDAVVPFPMHKRVVGAHLKMGEQGALGRSRHLYYDVYAGLGVRNVSVYADAVDGIPYVHSVGGQFSDPYRPRDRQWLPSVAFGIKLGYRFR